MSHSDKRFLRSYFKKRQKENRKLVSKAAKMLQDEQMLERYPHLKEGADPMEIPEDEQNFRGLIEDELKKMEAQRESDYEQMLQEEQAEMVSTELATEKQRRRWYSFYKRKPTSAKKRMNGRAA